MAEILAQVRWIDVIDILIVAFAVYQLLLTFRGTKAFQMLVSLVLLYLASRVSLWTGLLTVNWILQNLLAVWILLLIVLFQPELRRALASFGGRGDLLRAFGGVPEAHLVDELVRTVASLSDKRVGAIIVLERGSRLADSVESGVPLDAVVSRRLLESIFYPLSPLHDGAVIIHGERVVAAGCFLPLALNPNLGRDLGTRHRAAIGVTEETDAVAIVVSEETGAISLVAGGEIGRDLDPLALRRRLAALLRPAARRGLFFRRPGSAGLAPAAGVSEGTGS